MIVSRVRLLLVCCMCAVISAACTQASTPTPAATSEPETQEPTEVTVATETPEPSPSPIVPTAISAIPAVPPESSAVALELVAEGFSIPVALKSPPDGTGRRFIVDQTGTIHILTAEGELLPEPFLDIKDKLVSMRNTVIDWRGLVGFAFHPDYASNGRFYVFYTAAPRPDALEGTTYTSTVSEFTVSADDTNFADPASERILVQHDQRVSTAWIGGPLVFGPDDGYLYIAIGIGDREGQAPSPDAMNGAVLRIDVDGDPYATPADNPFWDGPQPEVFAYGLRNPSRMSADPVRGEIYVVDERFNFNWAEVNVVTPGANYGWSLQDNSFCYDYEDNEQPLEPRDDCLLGSDEEVLTPPIAEYPPDLGLVISGAMVYRGTALPELTGKLIIADSGATSASAGQQGKLFVAAPQEAGVPWMWPLAQVELATPLGGDRFIWALGEDADGELYLLTMPRLGGLVPQAKIFKVIPAP